MIEFSMSIGAMRRAWPRFSRGMSTATISVGVAALVMNTACYAYFPRSQSQLAPGQHVQVKLNDAGRAAVAVSLGDSVTLAEGDLISAAASGIRMSVTDVRFLSTSSAPRDGVNVTISRENIATIEAKRFARVQTVGLVVGIGLGLFALVKAVNVHGEGAPGGSNPHPGTGAGN